MVALGSLQRVSTSGAAVGVVTYLGSYSGKVVERFDYYVQNMSIVQNNSQF